jgi:RNA polymerase sigma-70 factor (ECF subfamily)
MDESAEPDELLARAAEGSQADWTALLTRYGERLRRMVALRLDPRLQGRVDTSDVLQEVYLEAFRQLPDYLHDPTLPFFLWLRFLAAHKLGRIHRHYLGTQARDARREVSLDRGAVPEASSAALAAQLVGHDTPPSEAAARAERKRLLQEALERMDPLDREVVALRHFEQLSRAETARVLGISEAATAKRYLRALARLKETLALRPGGLEGLRP